MKLTLDKPLQIRVQESIIEMISDEKLLPGDQLPTESELYNRFGVGRSTVRESLSNLVQQGVLLKMQGKGTFIRSVPLQSKKRIRSVVFCNGKHRGCWCCSFHKSDKCKNYSCLRIVRQAQCWR